MAPSQVKWVEAFLENADARLLNIYDGARIISRQFSDRQQAAQYWKDNAELFSDMLRHLRRIEDKLRASHLAQPEGLAKIIQTATDIVEACRGAHEFHS